MADLTASDLPGLITATLRELGLDWGQLRLPPAGETKE
jgi:hypothetical protein